MLLKKFEFIFFLGWGKNDIKKKRMFRILKYKKNVQGILRKLFQQESQTRQNQRKFWTEAEKRIIASKQNYFCNICKNTLPPQWNADHIIPLMNGGTNDLDNCQILCPNCHAAKTQQEMILFSKKRKMCSKYFQ